MVSLSFAKAWSVFLILALDSCSSAALAEVERFRTQHGCVF